MGLFLKALATCCKLFVILGQIPGQMVKKKLATYILLSKVLLVTVSPCWSMNLKGAMVCNVSTKNVLSPFHKGVKFAEW
jgi:hypothetical protein